MNLIVYEYCVLDYMGAPSKRARKIRVSAEFNASRLAAEVQRPKDSSVGVFSWTLADISQARDMQMRGYFLLASRMADAMRTDDALAVAYENRLAPQRCIPVKLKAAPGARGKSIKKEAEALFGQDGVGIHPDTLADVHGCLVNHGVAFGICVYTPREDGTRVDVELKYFPIEYVMWDRVVRCFKARVDPATVPKSEIAAADLNAGTYGFVGGAYLPIVHGDGRWVVFKKHEIDPWKQEAAILPGCLVWARHAYAVRDWAKGSVAHGAAKIVGEMPAGSALQQADGAMTPEAASMIELLRAMANGDAPIGIRPAGSKTDYVVNNSTAWQVWSELVSGAEKAAARIYLGTDGTLGTQGGAPGVDIASLFGVATTKIEGDLRAIERGLSTGVIEPWCAMNFGDSSLAPKRLYKVPNADREKNIAARATRMTGFWAAIKSAHDSGIIVDQDYVTGLAADFEVRAPLLPAGGMVLSPPVAGGDPKPKPMHGTTPMSQIRPPLPRVLP